MADCPELPITGIGSDRVKIGERVGHTWRHIRND
jgi:hypothetical protein